MMGIAEARSALKMTTAQPDLPDVDESEDCPAAAMPPTPTARDVDPRQYPVVIREMIRHENELTNHRIMWLLIVQGLLVNAYVSARPHKLETTSMLAVLGILVTLSAFVMLYKSY